MDVWASTWRDCAAGVAWLTLVVGLRRRRGPRPLRHFPVSPRLGGLAGPMSIGDSDACRLSLLLLGAVVNLELSGRCRFGLDRAWQPEACGRLGLRLVVVLSGYDSLWFRPRDHRVLRMVSSAGADWDMPTGNGYLIFATITISAILTVIMTLLMREKIADPEPQQDHGSRPYDAADVSRSPAAGRARVPSRPKQLIIGALVQVVSISLGVGLGYLAFLNVFSILDRKGDSNLTTKRLMS